MGVGVVQDQALDAVAFEGDRRGHPVEPVHREEAGLRLPGSPGVGAAEPQLQGARTAVFQLLQGEDGVRGVVLVHPHVVQQQLQGGGAVQRVGVAVPAQPEAFDGGEPPVGGFVVVGDGLQRAVEHAAVGESAFAGEVRPGDVAREEARAECAFPFPAERNPVVGVAERVFVRVPEEAVRVAEAGRQGVAAEDEGRACADGVGGAVLHPEHAPRAVRRRVGLQRQHSAHRIAPVEGALRATEQRRAAEAFPVEVVCVLVQHGDPIDVEPQDGVFHPRAEAAQIDGRGEGSAVVRNVQAGDLRGERIRTKGAALLEALRANCGIRCGNAPEGDGFFQCRDGRGLDCVADRHGEYD